MMNLFSLLLVSLTLASNVLIATNRNFDDIVTKPSDKLTLVEYYATWCTHCKTLAPIYEKLADHYANNDRIQIVKIECEANRAVCSQFKIRGFPTLRLYKDEHEKEFEGKRTLSNLIKFIDENDDGNTHNPQIESNVKQVSQFDFDQVLNQGKDLYVAVTASWCGYCQKLKPDWEKLSDIFANDNDSIIIAELSITTQPAENFLEKHQIQAFPTILHFKNGTATPVEYEGDLSLEALVNHVNNESGLYRDLEGKLSASAGLLPEIDELIFSLESHDDIHSIISKLEGNDAFNSRYYKKLLNKVLNGEKSFFAKEAQRIEKLRTKVKDLSWEMLDNLQNRLNILNVFQNANSLL